MTNARVARLERREARRIIGERTSSVVGSLRGKLEDHDRTIEGVSRAMHERLASQRHHLADLEQQIHWLRQPWWQRIWHRKSRPW